jgi:hypothetical protein
MIHKPVLRKLCRHSIDGNKDFGPPAALLYHTAGDARATDAVNVTDVRSVLVSQDSTTGNYLEGGNLYLRS